MKKLWYYNTLIGKIGIVENNGMIINLNFHNDLPSLDCDVQETELLWQASVQLNEFLDKKLKNFSLPLYFHGSSFMKDVWFALTEIPYGETRSYKDIAYQIGKKQAYRAVGAANNCNPLPIFLPCHRVIGNDGGLVGYRGGLEIKSFLLEMEKSNN
ncbi:methylated-DNA-[protein]-cysteine S-methyltransferase [Brevinema andersonii]|uniref:Methylated-DNA--protein-cysteine methyltransferase n=1 Tax=Brevinema andersonii TaxID=34097 RepID=A0A1I1DP87_BREAD|nr:methylated-DNA--[protein]-cysteine S-methyltransferase [Brevinema andersonii]SFB76654.1 methylated-DNA-[protein]-cysteine S-methyltransferase [Brevinema andersonii]